MNKFISFLEERGFVCDKAIVHDHIIRFGKNNRYWLIYKGDHGTVGDWVTGEQYNWFENEKSNISLFEQRALSAKRKAERAKQVVEQEAKQKFAAKNAFRIYQQAETKGTSEYLTKKQISALGICRFEINTLIIPMRDVNDNLWNVQRIYPNGDKRFLKDGKKKGCYYIIDNSGFETLDKVFLCEGFATGASIYHATGTPVIICFDAGNIFSVLESIKAKYPNKRYVISADDDAYGKVNTGRRKALEVCAKMHVSAYVPIFKDRSSKPTDFNDLHCLEGLGEVKKQLGGVFDENK
jgi:putative DNA primase/helicase